MRSLALDAPPLALDARPLPLDAPTVYAVAMDELPSGSSRASSGSIGRTVVAVLILAVAAWVLFHVVIGIVTFLAGILVVVVAIVAVVWALRVIL
jgi:hypothetical protein